MSFDVNPFEKIFESIEMQINEIDLLYDSDFDASADSYKENLTSNRVSHLHDLKKDNSKKKESRRPNIRYDDATDTDEELCPLDEWQVSKSPCKNVLSQSRARILGTNARSSKVVSPVKLKRKSDFCEEPTKNSSKANHHKDSKFMTDTIEKKLKEISLRTPDRNKSTKLVESQKNSPLTTDKSKTPKSQLKDSPSQSVPSNIINLPPRSAKKSLNYMEFNSVGKQDSPEDAEEVKQISTGSASRGKRIISSPHSTKLKNNLVSPKRRDTPSKSQQEIKEITSDSSVESEASPSKSKKLSVNLSSPRSAKRSLKYSEVSPEKKRTPQKPLKGNDVNLDNFQASSEKSDRKQSGHSSKNPLSRNSSAKKKETPHKSREITKETYDSDSLEEDSEMNHDKTTVRNRRSSRSIKQPSYCELKSRPTRSSKRSLSYCELSPEKKKTPSISRARNSRKDYSDSSESDSEGKPVIPNQSHVKNSPTSTPSRKPNAPFPPSPLLKDGVVQARKGSLRSPKVPLQDDDFIYTMRRPSMASPRTPSTNLRKLVLEARTPTSAKKKLVMDDDEVKVITTPTKKSPLKTPKKTPSKDDQASPRMGKGFMTPSYTPVKEYNLSSIDKLRMKLHTAAAPESLPCREEEFANIYSFVESKILNRLSGCMYISGVPGTGKTATVHGVIKSLQKRSENKTFPSFDFVEINGLRIIEPRLAYVRLWKCLSGQKLPIEQSLRLLEKKFSSKPKKATVFLVDELDYLCNRRQDVIYNILDWPSIANSKLIVLSIANTMDLPERTLKGKVTSRMGLTRLVFQPYNFKQLQQIVLDRISGSKHFHVDAVQLVSRKVAAVSGDARRALGICRRATEMLKKDGDVITVELISQVLEEIFSGPRIIGIKHALPMEKMTLRAIRDEALRTGVEETRIIDIYSHFKDLCNIEGTSVPNISSVMSMCHALSRYGFINMEKGRKDILSKICLNVSPDDIHYALSA